MHQPSRGETEMIYYPPKEAGGSLAPLEPQLQDIFCFCHLLAPDLFALSWLLLHL